MRSAGHRFLGVVSGTCMNDHHIEEDSSLYCMHLNKAVLKRLSVNKLIEAADGTIVGVVPRETANVRSL